MKELIFRIVAALFPYSFGRRIKNWGIQLYTQRIKNAIGYLGKFSLVEKPCLLQGGGEKKLTIGHHTRINAHAVIGLWTKFGSDTFEPEIKIGNNCNIGEYCHLSAINKITIGDGLLTGRFVYIGDNSHGSLSWEEANIAPESRKLITKGVIKIGNNVWIGDKVTILGGVTIGDNAIVGSNSVVTHDIPSNSSWAGIPAKEIKHL